MKDLKFDIQRFIDNSISGAIVPGTSDGEYIYNSGDSVTIDAQGGNDSILNDGDYVSINAGYGDDSIFSMLENYLTVNSGYGNDTISLITNNSKIDAWPGNDYIFVSGNNNTIYGDDGYDTINTNGGLIYGGNGNDIISLSSGGTIDGGYGDDTIYGNNSAILYKYYGRGYDVIYNWSFNDTLSISDTSINYTPYITETSYALSTNGSDFIISVYLGSITLVDAVGKTVNINGIDHFSNNTSSTIINGTSNGDFVLNSGQYVTISTDSGNDTVSISNGGDSSSIITGDGDDSIYDADGDNLTIYGGYGNDTVVGNYWGSKIYGGSGGDLISIGGWITNTIDGGDGNDTIYAEGGTIDGGAGADKISLNSGNYSGRSVKGGVGSDTIYGDSVSGSYGIVYQYSYGDGYDTIYNAKSSDTLQITGTSYTTQQSGSDLLVSVNGGSILVKGTLQINGNFVDPKNVTGTSGADYIENTVDGATINAYGGSDTIYNNDGDSSSIDAGDGNDSIFAYDNDYVTVYAGYGDDTVKGSYYSSKIYGGNGADLISISGGSNNTIEGGDGNDTISVNGGSINGGAGNDSIYSANNSTTVYGGDGADTINIAGGSVNGGYGADFITLIGSSYSRTIKGGYDNDIIYGDTIGSGSIFYQYSSGDGNDTIYRYKSNDTISLGGGYYTRETVGSNVIVSVIGSGAMTLYGASDKKINIIGGNETIISPFTEYNDIYANSTSNTILKALGGNDSISNSATKVTINGDAGADTISNSAESVVANGGDGDDDITSYGYHVDINGGKGNEIIYNEGSYVDINGDEGNDSIYSYGDWVIINGGKGDDKISINAYSKFNAIQYASGDGNDIIYGLNYNDTIHITSGSISNSVISGNDVILNVGTGTITLKDIISQKFYLQIGSNPAVETIFEDEPIITVPTGWKYANDAKTSVIATLKTAENLNLTEDYGADVVTVNASITSNGVEIYGNAENNLIRGGKGNNYISGGSGKDTIYGGAGDDTVSLGSAADVYIYSSGEDVIQDYAVGQDTIQFEMKINSASLKGADLVIYTDEGEVIVKNVKDTDVSVKDSTGSFKIRNVYPTIVPDPLPDGWKYTSTLKTAMIAILATPENLDLNESYGADVVTVNASMTSGGVEIIGNDKNNSIRGGKGADTISGGAGNDTVSLGAGADTYVYSGGNDYIHDYKTDEDFLELKTKMTGSSISGSNLIIKTAKGNITIKDGKDKIVVGKDTNGTFVIPDTVPPIPEGWSISGSKASATIATADKIFDLTEDYGEGIATVDGVKITSGVEIIGNDKNNSIRGGKGADTISGGAGNDTVSLGAGADVYIYTGGNDLIQDYKAGEDIIEFETEITSASLSGSNLIITTDEGKVTVKGGKDKKVEVIDTSGTFIILNEYPAPPDGLYKVFSEKADNIQNLDDNATIDALGGIDKIVNEANEVSINAGAGNDKITIESGAESVTVYGGAGNDLIENSGSGNLYQYADGDGKDTIVGYDENDTLHITKGSYTHKWSGSDLIVTVGKGSITLKDVGGKEVHIKNASGNIEDIGNESLPEGWKYTEGKKKLTATGDAENLDLSKTYGNGVETVDGSKSGGVEIKGNADNNSIKGGKGENILDGGEGNDILVGTEGYTDVFVYNDGDDVIKGYEYKEDVKDIVMVDIKNIQNQKKNIERYISDDDEDDIIYDFTKLGAGVLTVQGGNGKSIKLVDTSGKRIILDDPPKGWKINTAKNLLQASVSSPEDNEIDLTKDYGENISKVDGAKVNNTVDLEIIGNEINNSLKGGAGNDTLDGGGGTNDTLTGGKGNDVFVYSGGDDVFTDYAAGKDSIRVALDDISGMEVETIGSDVIYYTSEGTFKVTNGKDKKITLMDENEKVIVIGGSGSEFPSGWKYDSAKKLLQASISSADNEIDLTEPYGNGVEKVDGSKIGGGVDIFGNDLDNSIKGGKGNDVLDGSDGNDTLTSGAGDDVFVYSGGDDVFTDYTEGKDSIMVAIDDISGMEVETLNSDLIYHTANGTFKVTKGKDKEIVLIDENEKVIKFDESKIPDGWKYGSTKKLLQASVASADKKIDLNESYGMEVVTVNASITSSGVQILGNSKNNSIKGGKGADKIYGDAGNDKIWGNAGNDKLFGDAGNDSLYGGNGNDTLTGGAGSDLFIYEGGKDVITDYIAGQDKIKISSGTITKTAYNNKDLVLTIGSGTLTVQNAKGKKITITDSSNKTTTQTYSKTLDLLYDNNFVTDEFGIDEICEQKFAVTEIQAQNHNLEQEQNILTFSDDK